MKFSIKEFFSECDQILTSSYLLKKSLMENFIFLCSDSFVEWELHIRLNHIQFLIF